MNNCKSNIAKIFKSNRNLIASNSGMTLIEILIALTLISLMGTFIAGKVFDTLHEGQVQSAKIQMKGFEALLKEFRRKCGFYPTTEQTLDALINKPTGSRECKNYPPEGFIEGGTIPLDPWEGEYVLESDGKEYNIISYGGDGQEGGEAKDADIYLKEKK